MTQRVRLNILKETVIWTFVLSMADMLVHIVIFDIPLESISLYSFATPLIASFLFFYLITIKQVFAGSVRRIHRLEAESRTLARSLERILNLHAITSSTDIAGVIVAANDNFSKISGYSQKELIGKTHRLLKSGEHSKAFYKDLWQTIANGGTWKGDLCNKDKSGQYYWVTTTIIPRRDEEGKHIGYDRSSTDITALKNQQQILSTALLSKSAFLSQMSHELRTPLNSIVGFAHVLEEQSDTLDENDKKAFLGNIKSSGKHLVALIGNILDFNKLEMGKTQLELKPVYLSQIVDMCDSTFNLQCLEKNVALNILCPQPEFQCLIDLTAMNQVLINLIGNAIKFTQKGSITVDLSVTVVQSNTILNCSISDTGKGIEADKFSHIFDEFTQEDNTILRAHGGTGLGLSISNKLAHLMLGEINLISEIGKGSTFNLSIPVKEVKTIPKTSFQNLNSLLDKPAPTVVTTNQQTRILVVDDLEINRLVLRAILKPYDCNIDEAENGVEAIALVKKTPPYTLILMDLHMPVMGGLLAASTIRKLDDNEKAMVKIIAFTADAQKEVIDQCMDAGMDSVITKPISIDMITQLMEGL